MGELLHVGALVPATVGACCTLGARRSGRAASTLSALLMLAAMLDTASGMGVVPVVGWAGLLLITAVVSSAVARPRVDSERVVGGAAGAAGGTGTAARAVHTAAMGLHGRLGLVVMAALLLAMGVPGLSTEVGPSISGHHAGDVAGLGAIALAASAGYAVYSGFASVRAAKDAAAPALIRWGSTLEAVCMGASVILMTAAIWT